MPDDWDIVCFDATAHRDGFIALYNDVFGYTEPHHDPGLVVEKKLEAGDGLFFVALSEAGDVIGSVMAGYDGHRGWIYSLAVAESRRKQGLGRALMARAEEALASHGCLKINLQILEGNADVEAFYHKLGFQTEPRISMGKRLEKKNQ